MAGRVLVLTAAAGVSDAARRGGAGARPAARRLAADGRRDRRSTGRCPTGFAVPGCDANVVPAEGRRKRMLIADMDSTIIGVECIDELADFAGVKAEVAAITEAAMRGELDFEGGADRAGRAAAGACRQRSSSAATPSGCG